MNDVERKAITEAIQQMSDILESTGRTVIAVNNVVDLNVESIKGLEKRLSNVESLLDKVVTAMIQVAAVIPDSEKGEEENPEA